MYLKNTEPYIKEAFTQQLLYMLISLHIPFRTAENLQFRHFVRMLSNKAMIPSATYIHQQLENQVQFIKEHILNDLPTGAKISLTIDYWSSPHCLAFMAINGYFIDKDWQYCEVLLGFK